MDYSPGLRGVIAGETSISTVGKEGTSLRYRGYDAIKLTEEYTYENVASLILNDDLNSENFNKFYTEHYNKLSSDNYLNGLIDTSKENLHPMDVLKVVVSFLGESSSEDKTEQTTRLIAAVCYVIASYDQKDSNELDEEFLVASSLLPNNSSKEKLEALDDILILYAEHGFNASTFATRVTASTRSDLTSSIVSGIGTLKGELHGGANEKAVEMISQYSTVDEANDGVLKLLNEKKKIMGFGHGVYKIQDPRSPVVKKWVEVLSTTDEAKNKFEIAKKIDTLMDSEKNLFPNVDFYGGLLLHELGFLTELFTPIFVAGRTAGWAAHYFEQRQQDILIRPAAKYIGPSER